MSEVKLNDLVPMKYNGKDCTGYYITKAGEVFTIKKMGHSVSGTSKYAKTSITVGGNSITVPIHQAVAHTFLKRPELIPDGISKSEWKKTPAKVKDTLLDCMVDVHHKNFDKSDNRLVNLEFLCRSKNRSQGNGKNDKAKN